jgi:hypothetical protein
LILNPDQRMKTTISKALLGSALLCCALPALAQSYSIDWFTIDGGGGTGTGGMFAVSGTVGQPDAGNMSGGSFSLTGGFWSLIAVQMPDAPRLMISFTSTNTALVSWPSPSTGWSPQQNTNLNTTNWAAPFETVNDNGMIKFMLVNPPTGNRFFRLFKP